MIDPLTSAETARAALALVREHLGERPVSAVIYTHSHIDHFAGLRGVVDEDDAAGRVPIIAPAGFLEAAVSRERDRRARHDPPGELHVRQPAPARCATGTWTPGSARPSRPGRLRLVAPTEEITATGTELTIDGVRIVFQLTPDTEAPAEMNFHFPDLRVLCMAENCTQHAPQPVHAARGAGARRAGWSKYINESHRAVRRPTDVVFASHHWPRWGRATCAPTSRPSGTSTATSTTRRCGWPTTGTTMAEIAEELDLPPSLGGESATAGYYGTVSHNVKAVYQRYLGWFDGNPAHLHPHPPVEAARRVRRVHGRRRRRPRPGPRGVRGGRLPLGGAGGEPRGVRRPGQHRGAASSRPTRSSSSATRPSRGRGATST